MKSLLAAITLSLIVSGCGSSSSEQIADTSEVSKSALGDDVSVEVGAQLPANGTRVEESLCSPGTFVKASSNPDSCRSEQFEVFLDNGFYAERGFTEKEYYFWEALTETYEAPKFVTNNLNLVGVELDGFDNTLCTFFCSEDGQSMKVLCIDRGVLVCGETTYVRTAEAPPVVDPAIEQGECSAAQGSYTLEQVSCNPGVTLSGEQLGEPLTMNVESAADIQNVSVTLSGQNSLPGTTSEAHFTCSEDGNEIHIISSATSNGFSVSCDHTFLR